MHCHQSPLEGFSQFVVTAKFSFVRCDSKTIPIHDCSCFELGGLLFLQSGKMASNLFDLNVFGRFCNDDDTFASSLDITLYFIRCEGMLRMGSDSRFGIGGQGFFDSCDVIVNLCILEGVSALGAIHQLLINAKWSRCSRHRRRCGDAFLPSSQPTSTIDRTALPSTLAPRSAVRKGDAVQPPGEICTGRPWYFVAASKSRTKASMADGRSRLDTSDLCDQCCKGSSERSANAPAFLARLETVR